MYQIDSIVKPVANAINKTGLLKVFVGRKPNFSKNPDDYMEKCRAQIYCKPLNAFSLTYIELLIEKILRDYVANPVHWEADLSIHKRYIADSDKGSPIEFSFDFIIKAFNPNQSEKDQIKDIKKGLDCLKKSIIKNSKSF